MSIIPNYVHSNDYTDAFLQIKYKSASKFQQQLILAAHGARLDAKTMQTYLCIGTIYKTYVGLCNAMCVKPYSEAHFIRLRDKMSNIFTVTKRVKKSSIITISLEGIKSEFRRIYNLMMKKTEKRIIKAKIEYSEKKGAELANEILTRMKSAAAIVKKKPKPAPAPTTPPAPEDSQPMEETPEQLEKRMAGQKRIAELKAMMRGKPASTSKPEQDRKLTKPMPTPSRKDAVKTPLSAAPALKEAELNESSTPDLEAISKANRDRVEMEMKQGRENGHSLAKILAEGMRKFAKP